MDVKSLRAAGVLESKPPVQRFRGMRAIVFFFLLLVKRLETTTACFMLHDTDSLRQ